MPTRPNILVFLTDDHGRWATGCYGNSEIRSPSMDRLAAEGCRMTATFTPSPVCSPARASFFTGRLPSQHGIHDWIHETIEPGDLHPGLEGQTTIAQVLKSVGYQTALTGKWHCGTSWEPKAGFDRWFSYRDDQLPHCGHIRFCDQGTIVEHEGQQADAITDAALDFLRRRDSADPFFLCVGYVDTHSPFSDHPQHLVASYEGCSFRDALHEPFAACHGYADFAWPQDEALSRQWLAQYYAAVTFIDEQIARVLDELAGRGELSNTLVVYTSDHGHMNGRHGLQTKGNSSIPQNFLDDSILVPCMLRWPDGLPASTDCDAAVPTLLANRHPVEVGWR